ncbi:hypothetical protein GCM10023085_17520 [Actinomadura viridis]|uniref:Catechol 2,3-dioxygenase-like lactoylglutathione lyase family enzyme n=1 Tax=Actinomadura viridis TaxID=58110 RepID=A0A931DLX6_9ACTN|nr:VOC family protein [Actinomadura viridis]MBG6089490.1 catechol 2,3-dioxygenase-like lactoylglutathione lyase family enzyme [Actinomadura viridis]
MSEYVSPVPMPALDAAAPEIYRGIYGMPMFVTVPTPDLEASRDFWVRGLGFVDLFSVPGRLTHLRRWAFQDVLLVPAEEAGRLPAMSVGFSCVLGQLDQIAERCEGLVAGCTGGPREMPWNAIELTVVTPENVRVVMTAAQPLDPDSAQADRIRAMGIEVPRG